jgi:citrate lyase subunit beta/citryl-CoA lyase
MAGLAWDAEPLSEMLGARRRQDGAGRWTAAFEFVRAQALLTAHACELFAIDALNADLNDREALEAAARASCADGFSGMLATDPAQVPVINAAFAPGEAELEQARRLLSAFERNIDLDALQFDRRVVSQAQLRRARHMLGIDEQGATKDSRAPILRLA